MIKPISDEYIFVGVSLPGEMEERLETFREEIAARLAREYGRPENNPGIDVAADCEAIDTPTWDGQFEYEPTRGFHPSDKGKIGKIVNAVFIEMKEGTL